MEKETWALLGAAAAVATPLIYNTLKEAIWDTKKRNREERYIIVQLLFTLDKYIAECEFLAGNDGQYDPKFQYKVMSYDRPKLELSLVKGDYKYLDTGMLYRLHSIESKHMQAIHALANLDDECYDDAPDFSTYFAKRRELYAIHGLYAVELSEDICRKFKIRHVSWEGGFNPAESIRARLKQIRASRTAMTLRRMEVYARKLAARARQESIERQERD